MVRDPESQSRSVLQKAGLLRQTRIIKSQSPVPADSRFEAVSPVVVPFSLSYSHSLHRILSVSAGLGFVSMGSEFKADNMSTDINTRWEIDDRRIFHYLTIPVGVQLMLPIRNGGLYGYDYGLVNISEAVFDGEKVGTRTGVLTILCVGFRYNTLDKYRK